MFDEVNDGFESIPDGLDGMAPGDALAAVLSSINVDELSGFDLIVVLRAAKRMASHYEALAFATMAAVWDRMEELEDDPDSVALGSAAEVRAALRLTRRAADTALGTALDLCQRLPRLWQALAAGEVDVPRVWVIVRETGHLPADTAREVVEQVIEDAPRLTTGQLGARIRRLCLEADPEEAEQRYETAVEGRRVVAEPTPEGTGNLLGLDLPVDRVALVSKRINYLARSLKTSDEGRTMDQLRADVFLDLLQGKTRSSHTARGTVDLQADLETLAGLAESPGELSGFGPVIADVARQVTAQQTHSQWRFTVTDQKNGREFYGTTRRRPTAMQRRAVQMRDRTCVFPGCRNPAVECDLDHTVPWAESHQTKVEDLAPGCRHDHVMRHRCGWTYRRLPNGDYLWTSRLGHQYTTSGLPP